MKKLLVLSTLLLSACGAALPGTEQNDPRTIVGVDPAFQSYVSSYVADKHAPLAYDIPIQFSAQSGTTVAVCTRWSNGYRQIQVDPTFWNSYSATKRKEVIYHELGHCDLNRDHNTEVDSYGIPKSIMYPYSFGLNWYGAYQELLFINELFNPSTASTDISLSIHDDAGCVHDVEVESDSN